METVLRKTRESTGVNCRNVRRREVSVRRRDLQWLHSTYFDFLFILF